MPNETSTTEGTLEAMKAWMQADAAAAKEEAERPSDCSALSICPNPISHSDKPIPIQTVLRILASQEGCDGHPWDQMFQAADYIDFLQQNDQSPPTGEKEA